MKWTLLIPLFAASCILAARPTTTILPAVNYGPSDPAPLTISQPPSVTNAALQRRKGVTITETTTSLLTSTQTIFITEHDISFNNVTVTTEIFSTLTATVTAFVPGPTVTNTATDTTVRVSLVTEMITNTATSSLTHVVTSTVSAPTVTATANPVAKPETLVQRPWFHVLLSIFLTLLAATWPLMLLGMWMQRQRSRKIRNQQHQINPEADMPLEHMAAMKTGEYI